MFEDFERFIKRKPSYTREKPLKKVLKEYYLEIKIFIKQDPDILPNHRPKNHKIELLKSKQTFFVRNYKALLEQEKKAMKKYINKHFKKDFIRPSSLNAAASVLLVRKIDGKLRFYVDYRVLNKITTKI